MGKQRIAFLGTPEISAFLLEGLVKAGFDVALVVTKEDKVRGRNGKVEESPVAKAARRLSIPCHKPHRLNREHEFLLKEKCDLLLTFAYGQILSAEVLALSRLKPLNLHASLLPRYRGAAPIQYALRSGDSKTGVTLMEMVKEMDAGDIYAQKEIVIADEDNASTLSEKVARTALELAVESLPLYFDGLLIPRRQDESLVSFAPSIKKEEEKLSLAEGKRDFVNHVRSLSLVPGAYLLLGEEILKVYQARAVSDEVLAPVGTVVRARKKEILLQLSDGLVALERLQRPGKKILTAQEFNNGLSLEGKVLA